MCTILLQPFVIQWITGLEKVSKDCDFQPIYKEKKNSSPTFSFHKRISYILWIRCRGSFYLCTKIFFFFFISVFYLYFLKVHSIFSLYLKTRHKGVSFDLNRCKNWFLKYCCKPNLINFPFLLKILQVLGNGGSLRSSISNVEIKNSNNTNGEVIKIKISSPIR